MLTFGSTPYGTNSIGGAWAPDLVAVLKVDQAWGVFQASFAAHDNHASYYTSGTTANETSGHPGRRVGLGWPGGLDDQEHPDWGPGDVINVSGRLY